MGETKTRKRKDVEEAAVIEDVAKPKTRKRKDVEEAVVIEDVAKPKTKKRKEEDEEAGSPRGSAPILPQVKKVRFSAAPDQIIPHKRNRNISRVSVIEEMAKPKTHKGKKEKKAKSSQGSVPTLPSAKKGRSTAAPPKTKKTNEEARPSRGSVPTLPTAKKGMSTAAPPKTKKRKEARPPMVSAPTLPTENKAQFATAPAKTKKKAASFPQVSVPPLPSAKRVQFAAAPVEIIHERRNMDDLWQAAFPVGTEWDQMDSIYKIQWDFSNLENAFEEGGLLYGKKVYLFGCTEPQLVPFENQLKVIQIPVTVAVVSSFPPSDKIGIKSVQMEGETIVPMKEMKMDWVPYVPFYDRHLQVENLKTQIYTLQCMQRRASLKQLKRERIKKYEYCLPYFYQPLKEDEIEQDTVVQIMYPTEPPVVCDFDWELDDFEEFTDNLVEDEVLTEDSKEDFKKFVNERVTEEKRKQRAAREARKKAIEDMSPGTKTAFENMRFYKFYPVQTPNIPDISQVKVPFINRYYGKAHEVL